MSFRPFQTRYLGYWLLFGLLVLAGALKLATPLLTVLFSVFILNKLNFGGKKLIAAALFVLLVLGIFYGFGYFIKQAVVALPNITEESLERFVEYAKQHNIPLPEDIMESTEPGKSAKSETVKWVREWVQTQASFLGNFAKIATKEFAFLLIGFVVGITVFLDPRMDLSRGSYRITNNLYSFACEEIGARFRSFFQSFGRVMGAQIIISILNTGFTAVYLICIGLPYTSLMIPLTFLCGMLPIVGNLISNAAIVALSFRVSPQLAIASLIFLIVLHKLEYFLNSKIIGDRIKNPVWLTLLGLIIGERLMGIPGMILAPVILDFIKVEASTIEVPSRSTSVTREVILENAEASLDPDLAAAPRTEDLLRRK
jgi:predicted PurR-regulated permease PerM